MGRSPAPDGPVPRVNACALALSHAMAWRGLQVPGFKLLAESGGLAAALAPALILMDLRMPVMDGFEALERLRGREAAQRLARTPVVAISASAYDLSEATLRASGFDGYLPKPVAEGPLLSVNGDWRRGFRDKVAMGDLEAAERCLERLEDPGLRETLRGHLQAYDLQVLLDHLG